MTGKILALSTFTVDNTHSGSKYALNNLYKRMAKEYEIIFVSLTEPDKLKKSIRISKKFENVQIPMSVEMGHLFHQYQKKYQISDVIDYLQIDHWEINIEFVKFVKEIIPKVDLIILEHPYFANLINSVNQGKPVIYHAIDAEITQKKKIYNHEFLLQNIKKIEGTACKIAKQIWNSSESEQQVLISEYNVDPNKIKLVPHGVSLRDTEFITREYHFQLKEKFPEINDKIIFIFPASWHHPNLEALKFIISNLAPINEKFMFFVIGNVKDEFFYENSKAQVPKNVLLFGIVTDKEKFDLYKLSDYAINPMFSGAGTNLKMTEYMAVGLPIISTNFGARGLKISEKTLLCNEKEIADKIRNIESTDYKISKSITENLKIVEENYDYDAIANNCLDYVNELVENPLRGFNKTYSNVIISLKQMGIIRTDPIISKLGEEILFMNKKS